MTISYDSDGESVELRLDDPQAFGEQCMDLFVRPGLGARLDAGEALPPADAIEAIQVVFAPGGGFEVRINNEVKVQFRAVVPADEDVPDPLRLEDMNIVATNLTGADADSAHITLLRLEGGWRCYVNLRYHEPFARQHDEAAAEFLDTASDALGAGRRRAFIENVFAAAELLARAYIYVQAEHAHIELKGRRAKAKHGKIEHTIERLGRENRVAPPSPEVLKRLGVLRRPARYLEGDLALEDAEASQLLDDVRAMRSELRKFMGDAEL